VFLSTHVRPELAEDYSDTINNRCRRFITSTMPLCMWKKKRKRERESRQRKTSKSCWFGKNEYIDGEKVNNNKKKQKGIGSKRMIHCLCIMRNGDQDN